MHKLVSALTLTLVLVGSPATAMELDTQELLISTSGASQIEGTTQLTEQSYLLKLSGTKTEIANAKSQLRELDGVVAVEPSRSLQLQAVSKPNDPLQNYLWHVNGTSDSAANSSILAPNAWGVSGGAGVTVAVLDTGITKHPDLDANVLKGYDFVSDVSSSNDSNGWDADPSDPGDWVTEAESASGPLQGCTVKPSSWHGTHVAGTIAAIQNNGSGISGIAPDAKILPVRLIGKCGAKEADLIAAITWASGGQVAGATKNANPAQVLNISAAAQGKCSVALQTAINSAIERGAVVIAAAGNVAAPAANFFPSNCAGVVSVAAHNKLNEISNYSNFHAAGAQMAITAPGGDVTNGGIFSTFNSGQKGPEAANYAETIGTSMATPHVAATAALIKQLRPELSGLALARELLNHTGGLNTPACTSGKCGVGLLRLTNFTKNFGYSLADPKVIFAGSRVDFYFANVPSSVKAEEIAVEVSLDGTTWSAASANGAKTFSASTLTPGATYLARFKSSPSAAWRLVPELIVARGSAGAQVVATAMSKSVLATWFDPQQTAGANHKATATSTKSNKSFSCESTGANCLITGLTDGESYRVSVAAATASLAETTATPASSPAAPAGLKLNPLIGKISATWSAPKATPGSKITGYLLSATASGLPTVSCVSTKTSCELVGAVAGAKYTVSATTLSTVGQSAASKPVSLSFKALDAAPIGVRSSKAASGANTQYTVSWSASKLPKASQQYRIRFVVDKRYTDWIVTSKPTVVQSFPKSAKVTSLELQSFDGYLGGKITRAAVK